MSVKPTQRWLMRWSLAALCGLLLLGAAPAYAGGLPYLDAVATDAYSFDSLNEWSLVPLSGARLEGQARLDSRQEFKLSTMSTGRYGLSGSGDLGPWAMRFDNTMVGLDQPRATYRYTWLSMRELDLKVGLTSNISQWGSSLRSGFASPLRFGNLPQMHMSGVGRLTDNWRIALDADGLWTARGRSLDLGLNVGYSLNRSMQVFGGVRMTDFGGDAEDFYGSGTSNTANVGLRYSF
jgi:hypothetical protein